MKVDVFKRKERFLRWKDRVLAEGIPGLTRENSNIVIEYVLDMEAGRNVANSSARGGRSYPRLCNLLQRMTWLAGKLEERGVADLRHCDEASIIALLADMQRGVIVTRSGTPYKSAGDYAKVFKAFWHWWMKVNRKQGHPTVDITEDLSTQSATPPFVYLSQQQLEQILPYFSEDEQVVLYFLFDSLVRSPTEVLSLRAGHVYERDGEVWITVPDEISKTFGRSLNLLYSGRALLDYLKRRQLSADDPLFTFTPRLFNRKLQQVAVQVFGDTTSHAHGDSFANITLYDLRHSGAVHFRLLAKDHPDSISLDAVRHRGGWADMKMLNYYTQFLGLDGQIKKQAMLLSKDKHRLEEEVETLRSEMAAIKEANARILRMAQEGALDAAALQAA